ncbi:NLI interacting factor [Macleaya cordata]|uniref:NLI interacting factor n=1 Tax=Macleaya cordata TaxID=56857 RepID=A0A200QT28_MACCD|nr:NLI interacting factor [Macleaya cordata]
MQCLDESKTDMRSPDESEVASCVSDATTCNFSANESTEFQDSIFSKASSSNYEQMGFETTFDIIPERCFSPFNEIQNMKAETSENVDELIEETLLNSNDSWLYFAIQQLSLSDQCLIDSYLGVGGVEEECLNPYLFPTSAPDLTEIVPPYLPFLLQREPQKRLPITLVLDLDETLVHSTLDACEGADFSFPVHFNMQVQTVYVRQRPYLRMFLEAVAGMFEIIIFTAGQSIYAEKLLDILDPDHTLIGQRIYRDSCVFSEGGYVKDLTILGRDLARIAIVDNSPQVFQLQVENGIPIESWFGDPSDDALLSLFFFLQTLVGVDDVRPIIKKKFGGQE